MRTVIRAADPRRRALVRRAAMALAVVAATLMGGCGDDDDDNPLKPQPGYPDRSTPQNVLTALILSYEARDSVKTKELYDSSYVGTSIDLSDPVPTQQTFTYSDEVAHVVALARTSSISDVVLNFGASSSWTRLPSEDMSHPEWATIQIAGGNTP